MGEIFEKACSLAVLTEAWKWVKAKKAAGGLLNEETRRKVAQNVLERLASLVPYRKRKIQLDEVIRLQPRRLARCLEREKAYRPFVGRY